MSGDVSDRKRLISLTKGNLANNHICISGHHDFFQREGSAEWNERDGVGRKPTLIVEGLDKRAV